MLRNTTKTSLLLLFAVVVPTVTNAQTRDYPKITFEYSSIFDDLCSRAVNTPIEQSAIKELSERITEFASAWDKDAQPLLTTASRLTRIPYAFEETKAAFHLCDAFSSMSIPLMFNMRSFLHTLHGDSARSMTQFTALVFHETLHRYITDIVKSYPGRTTSLLEKYKNEPAPVRNHLHLFSLMNEVYKTLGRGNDLEEIIRYERISRYKTIFIRAREIIDHEGTGAFIGELKVGTSRK